ncbi:MAG: helix-turn-helix domain-containing protein [Bacteroidota bacterium]
MIYATGIFGIFTLQLFYYFLKILKLYRRHRSYIHDHYSFTENISLNRMLVLMASLVLFFLGNQMLYIFGYDRSHFSPLIYNVLMLGITLFTGYYALSQKEIKPLADSGQEGFPDLSEPQRPVSDVHPITKGQLSSDFQGYEDHRKQGVRSETEISVKAGNEIPESAASPKYAGSPLSESRKAVLIECLNSLMIHEKIFKNDSLSVEDVAIRLETNSKYVSQVINERYEKNFYNYINEYRVEEAQKLLISGSWEKYSMLGIARMVGFGSKSSFNASFKRITGLTPSEYVRANN